MDQYCRDMQKELGNVKAETAAVMAQEARARRELDECIQEAAKNAVLCGKRRLWLEMTMTPDSSL